MRYEICYKDHHLDGRALRLRRSMETQDVAIADVYLIEPDDLVDIHTASEVFSDPVVQSCDTEPAARRTGLADWTHAVEICYRPGVTDPVAITAAEAIEAVLGKKSVENAAIETAKQYLFKLGESSDIQAIAALLYNPLIENATIISRQEWETGKRFPDIYPHSVAPSPLTIETVDIAGLDETELQTLSRQRLLALSKEEMLAVQRYFSDPVVLKKRKEAGLPEEITDVELEMLAQTWSEHCKHKILNARVEYSENGKAETIDSLFNTYIRSVTKALEPKREFLRSVFHDNSGVIEFDSETLVCFKVETHNSPSALDPYGGAITGIVGVNRDILGTGKGARPIFNTNVLCFGRPDTDPEAIPAGLLHPKRVLSGVHQGIVDGGNQSGIPVVGGAFLFDESYTGKPLVFCGTGGILPAEINGEGSWIKHIDPGDLAVMVGGRIGKDGIHGATFSSLALDESSPTSAVQIGDPITQKKMSDLLMEARDLGLYKGITDNGAGGLSSSLGEMAEYSGGVRIYLEKCPLKYEGLAPWEILVSESQERMSLAISPETLEAFLELAEKRDVEATVVGEFTDSGLVEVFHHGQPAALISIEFLHSGLPAMVLEAEWVAPRRNEPTFAAATEGRTYESELLRLLAEANIASKEDLIRQYDHEVQARSVIKPFSGAGQHGPSDGAVLRMKPQSPKGLTVTHGICPRFGDADTYHMATCAVDEAFRAHIAMGGNPDRAAVLDNFCWPDPVQSDSTPDGRYKMAQLVRACRGLYEACMAYKLPLISGKDSMKNDAVLDGKKVSVRPTLLISLVGTIDDIETAVNTDFKQSGDIIYILGTTNGELGGSSYERMMSATMGACPEVNLTSANTLYSKLYAAIATKLIASCHDISDGGLAVALAESALSGNLGVETDLVGIPVGSPDMEAERLLFCESPSRFVVSVPPASKIQFESAMSGSPFAIIGLVTDNRRFVVKRAGKILLDTDLDHIAGAFENRKDLG